MVRGLWRRRRRSTHKEREPGVKARKRGARQTEGAQRQPAQQCREKRALVFAAVCENIRARDFKRQGCRGRRREALKDRQGKQAAIVLDLVTWGERRGGGKRGEEKGHGRGQEGASRLFSRVVARANTCGGNGSDGTLIIERGPWRVWKGRGLRGQNGERLENGLARGVRVWRFQLAFGAEEKGPEGRKGTNTNEEAWRSCEGMGEESGVRRSRGQERTGVFDHEVPVGAARGRRHGNCVKRRSCDVGLANCDDALGGGDEAQLCCGKVRRKSAGGEGEG
ncbi:hypothetical protein ERJ75_000808900 [Trypanosoma vivax]|nr:hypothetical protein ERJ75_000808900 [Trypanosoma vivax]